MWTSTEDDKFDVESGSLKCFWSLKVFQVWWGLLSLARSSESDDLLRIWWSLQLLRGVLFFWSTVLISGWPNFRSSTIDYEFVLCFWWFNTCSILDGYIIWSCTLEHILVCPIVLQLIWKCFNQQIDSIDQSRIQVSSLRGFLVDRFKVQARSCEWKKHMGFWIM